MIIGLSFFGQVDSSLSNLFVKSEISEIRSETKRQLATARLSSDTRGQVVGVVLYTPPITYHLQSDNEPTKDSVVLACQGEVLIQVDF